MIRRIVLWVKSLSARFTHEDDSPFDSGIMLSKCLHLYYPDQATPDFPKIDIHEMNQLDAGLCAECGTDLVAPYDRACPHCGSGFHLHEAYCMPILKPRSCVARASLLSE